MNYVNELNVRGESNGYIIELINFSFNRLEFKINS